MGQVSPDATIYWYGSRVRGEARADSDWDFLILLNVETLTTAVERRVTAPLYDLEFDTGEVISPMVYTEKEWQERKGSSPFFQTIIKEGVRL